MPGFPRRLYKFRTVPAATDVAGRRRLEALLLDNTLWLADPDSFNDPFDGKSAYDLTLSGPELRQAMEHLFRRQGLTSAKARKRVRSDIVAKPRWIEEQLTRNMETMRHQLGVCALSEEPRNPLLWAHYANDHRGLCVQLDLRADLHALVAHPVEYQDEFPVLRDFDRDPDDQRAMLPFLRKSTDWAYEKEWRIVALDFPNTLRVFAPPALTGVIQGMRMTDDDKTYIRGLMDERERRFGVRPRVFQSVAAPRAYRVRIMSS